VSAGVTAALAGIQRFGKAEPGDKTMVDAIAPFTQTLAAEVAAGRALAAAWGTAATAATAAAAATADLLPRMGRARPHAAKSRGTVDAGAHSFALIVTAVGEVLNRGEDA
jgi:dihydroxyacetone kinase